LTFWSNPCFFMILLHRFLHVFFNMLYHPLAFAYDFVASIVSFGKWKSWVYSVIPLIEGTSILELGHGPGHLQLVLQSYGRVFAIDESAQMGKLARRRLGSSHRLTRALAQNMPYASGRFDTLISTFPSEYIFDMQSLVEAYRVLRYNGRVIILLSALPVNPLLRFLFRITGQGSEGRMELTKSRIIEILAPVKFKPEILIVEVKSGRLFIIVAKKED
jgi:ubiquinone/menaquinone biosynthesis C-methylase UbiE